LRRYELTKLIFQYYCGIPPSLEGFKVAALTVLDGYGPPAVLWSIIRGSALRELEWRSHAPSLDLYGVAKACPKVRWEWKCPCVFPVWPRRSLGVPPHNHPKPRATAKDC
jgi:hypothetical protein